MKTLTLPLPNDVVEKLEKLFPTAFFPRIKSSAAIAPELVFGEDSSRYQLGLAVEECFRLGFNARQEEIDELKAQIRGLELALSAKTEYRKFSIF